MTERTGWFCRCRSDSLVVAWMYDVRVWTGRVLLSHCSLCVCASVCVCVRCLTSNVVFTYKYGKVVGLLVRWCGGGAAAKKELSTGSTSSPPLDRRFIFGATSGIAARRRTMVVYSISYTFDFIPNFSWLFKSNFSRMKTKLHIWLSIFFSRFDFPAFFFSFESTGQLSR